MTLHEKLEYVACQLDEVAKAFPELEFFYAISYEGTQYKFAGNACALCTIGVATNWAIDTDQQHREVKNVLTKGEMN